MRNRASDAVLTAGIYAIAADGSTSRALTTYDGIPREQLTFDIDPSWR